MTQPYFDRPSYHLTPPQMWMNDPNDLVYYNGHHWHNQTLRPGRSVFADVGGTSLEILTEVQLTNRVDRFGFQVRVGEGEGTEIGYLVKKRKMFVDRTQSGLSDFHDGFARIHYADLNCIGNILRLQIFVDQCSVEVFANDGLVDMTDCIFPSSKCIKLENLLRG